MTKVYVIKTQQGTYYSQGYKTFGNITFATFFDKEEYAYEYMARNPKIFKRGVTAFYEIVCMVVVFEKGERK